MKLLAIDVGMGTQDILLYDSEKRIENCFKMVLPSQTQIVAKQVSEATAKGQDVILSGETMGGGASSSAVMKHLKPGNCVYATEKAALTLNDDIQKVREMGIVIVSEDEARELDGVHIKMCDIDTNALGKAFSLFGVNMPERSAVAVQDHGYAPGMSNRVFRFDYFREVIQNGGNLDSFVYSGNIPERFSRMKAVERTLPGALFMDTGMAAVRGALLDENASSPCLAVNVGNGHTLACVVDGMDVLSVFEHHTGQMTQGKLDDYLRRLCEGTVDFQEVFDDGGHGCFVREAVGFGNIGSVLVTGPNRGIMKSSGLDTHFAAPFGDMMLTGCFGLMDAYINNTQIIHRTKTEKV